VAQGGNSERSQVHGTTGSGNILPISAITQEDSTSLLFTNSATDGVPLVAGQSIMIDIVRLSKIYAIAATDPSGGTCNLFWLDM